MNNGHYDNEWTAEIAKRVAERKATISRERDTQAAADFLEYWNNYLTTARWASDRGVSDEYAREWLARGKRVHNERAAVTQ